MEAMSSGLPVITTNWSAPTDYLTDKNAYLLDPHELVQADDPYFGSNLRHGKWADPQVEDVVEALLAVYKSRQLRDKLGRQARTDCILNWTWDKAAEKFERALHD